MLISESKIAQLKKRHFYSECRYCARDFESSIKTKDHVVALSKGGFDNQDNKVACCMDCNQWKADKSLSDWLYELRKLVKNDAKIKLPYNKNLVGTMIGRIPKLMKEIKGKESKVSEYKIIKGR